MGTKLMNFHTIKCNPEFYWENNKVAIALKNKTIKTFVEYQLATTMAGCASYSEECFNNHLEGK